MISDEELREWANNDEPLNQAAYVGSLIARELLAMRTLVEKGENLRRAVWRCGEWSDESRVGHATSEWEEALAAVEEARR